MIGGGSGSSGGSGSGSGSGSSGGSGGNAKETSEFKGGGWVAATAYLAERGISHTVLSEQAMDQTTWQRHRNSYLSTGQGGEEVANYSTYNEYLAAIANFIVENYK